MVTLNLKTFLVTLKGGVVVDNVDGKEITFGEIMANVILERKQSKKGFRPLPAWELAQKLIKQDTIELDNSVIVQMKDILNDEEQTQPLFIVAQLLEIIIKAEQEANKK